jgi:hypothetical protein
LPRRLAFSARKFRTVGSASSSVRDAVRIDSGTSMVGALSRGTSMTARPKSASRTWPPSRAALRCARALSASSVNSSDSPANACARAVLSPPASAARVWASWATVPGRSCSWAYPPTAIHRFCAAGESTNQDGFIARRPETVSSGAPRPCTSRSASRAVASRSTLSAPQRPDHVRRQQGVIRG